MFKDGGGSGGADSMLAGVTGGGVKEGSSVLEGCSVDRLEVVCMAAGRKEEERMTA